MTPTKRAISPPELKQGAEILRDTGCMGVLSVVGSRLFKDTLHPSSYQLYRNQLLVDSGTPTDPLEIMLLEQLAWAHFRIGDLHARASLTDAPEVVDLFTGAAAKLSAEFRRGVLALREYRSPIVPKQVTVVKQQNVAVGDQQVALIDQSGPNGCQQPEAMEPGLQANLEDRRNEQRPLFIRTGDYKACETVAAHRSSGLEEERFIANKQLEPPKGD